jgi:DNA-binding transcriptional ArsR family regulator
MFHMILIPSPLGFGGQPVRHLDVIWIFKEKLFGSLADRARLRILKTLCEGAKTVEQIATATGRTLTNVSVELERLVDCGCARPKRTPHSLLYTLNTPRFLELETVADEFLVASFRAPEIPS